MDVYILHNHQLAMMKLHTFKIILLFYNNSQNWFS